MTTFSMTIPLARPALHIPRRDLVLDNADDFTLQLTIVSADNPSAPPVGVSGARLRMLIWYRSWAWDYGLPAMTNVIGKGTVLWSDFGTVVGDGLTGRVDVTLPRGTASKWTQRLDYTLQLDQSGALSAIATGVINMVTGVQLSSDETPLLTDSGDPVLEDDLDPVEV